MVSYKVEISFVLAKIMYPSMGCEYENNCAVNTQST